MLNAFRHHRKTHTRANTWLLRAFCAQRLSASSEDSQSTSNPQLTHTTVLNAFRHHRKTHNAFSFCLKVILLRVLNAFRHHRKTHSRIDRDHGLRSRCSTPFGIIGRLTPLSLTKARTEICAQRLSASSEDSLCLFQPSINAVISAQRLSASSEDSQAEPCRQLAEQAVLNAFRHHRKTHSNAKKIGSRILLCSTPFGIIGRLTGSGR